MASEADFGRRNVGPQRLIIGCPRACFAAFLLLAWMWQFLMWLWWWGELQLLWFWWVLQPWQWQWHLPFPPHAAEEKSQ
eukprot:11187464-Ditylum_brightwellii.AAC.1